MTESVTVISVGANTPLLKYTAIHAVPPVSYIVVPHVIFTIAVSLSIIVTVCVSGDPSDAPYTLNTAKIIISFPSINKSSIAVNGISNQVCQDQIVTLITIPLKSDPLVAVLDQLMTNVTSIPVKATNHDDKRTVYIADQLVSRTAHVLTFRVTCGHRPISIHVLYSHHSIAMMLVGLLHVVTNNQVILLTYTK